MREDRRLPSIIADLYLAARRILPEFEALVHLDAHKTASLDTRVIKEEQRALAVISTLPEKEQAMLGLYQEALVLCCEKHVAFGNDVSIEAQTISLVHVLKLHKWDYVRRFTLNPEQAPVKRPPLTKKETLAVDVAKQIMLYVKSLKPQLRKALLSKVLRDVHSRLDEAPKAGIHELTS